MISTEEIYESLGISEADALEWLRKYTFGSNELNSPISIARYAACFAYELRKTNNGIHDTTTQTL